MHQKNLIEPRRKLEPNFCFSKYVFVPCFLSLQFAFISEDFQMVRRCLTEAANNSDTDLTTQPDGQSKKRKRTKARQFFGSSDDDEDPDDPPPANKSRRNGDASSEKPTLPQLPALPAAASLYLRKFAAVNDSSSQGSAFL